MQRDRQTFLDISSELTGYSPIDLEGTGLVDQYWKLVIYDVTKLADDKNGKDVPAIFYYAARSVLKQKNEKSRERAMYMNIITSPLLWPLCQSIVFLWYRGEWIRMNDTWYKYYAGFTPPNNKSDPGKSFVPSSQAYTEQLSYRAAGAHPPGAHPTGFGSWSLDPVFGDFTKSGKEVAL